MGSTDVGRLRDKRDGAREVRVAKLSIDEEIALEEKHCHERW